MQDGLSITAVPRAFSVSDLTVSKIYRSLPWREVKRRGIANERGDLIGNCRAGKIEGRLRRKVQLCERRVFGVLFEVGHGPLVHVQREIFASSGRLSAILNVLLPRNVPISKMRRASTIRAEAVINMVSNNEVPPRPRRLGI